MCFHHMADKGCAAQQRGAHHGKWRLHIAIGQKARQLQQSKYAFHILLKSGMRFAQPPAAGA